MNDYSAPTYPDEHIDYWGDVFTSAPEVLRHGILFETFLVAPQNILDLIHGNALQPLPLLPQQKMVMQRHPLCTRPPAHVMDDYVDDPALELHGDRVIQPTHKRAPLRKYKTRGHKKCAA